MGTSLDLAREGVGHHDDALCPSRCRLNDTRPETLARTDGFLGLRASKSSPTRGRPPVISLVFTLSRRSLAMPLPSPPRHVEVGSRGGSTASLLPCHLQMVMRGWRSPGILGDSFLILRYPR